VNRETALWVGITLVLLVAGYLVAHWFWDSADVADQLSFRQWLWVYRRFDLLAQVGLIFAGALGIAVLLPRGREDEE